ncbi:Kinesin-like protein [Actinidia chinensis var. chinensis]|uniref:Kinesin-like protein n=1 Tax=Actinidia chinensis var. chinensis TaxID=1590841 RepID=A0A2R6PYA1_ACTCC|nr:Kinesin-like protein [Actinidia chinensis var. chinensis]
MSGRNDKEKGVNVQVLLRCRPFSEEELRNNAPQVVTCNEYQREVAVSQSIAGKHIDRVFTFDKVFGPSAQQRDLYDQAVVPIVNEVLEGFNCTIFAYGQTGTGKTYTMEGECKRSKSGLNGELPPEVGVITRAVKQIFDTLESQNAEYSVKVTFLELYNEEITDLLAPEEISKVALEDRQKKQLPLMEDGKGGVLVRGLEEEIVTSANEIFTLLERGSSKRRTAETLLNKQSSRSHSLFSITIHIKEATPEGEELIKCGKLNLVDLAGSENISRSGAREGRAREAGEINKSLLTLGRVINALVEHLVHIPYRDSKLTRLLRDSLGGRTKTCIIATVSPAVHCLEETLSTLDYAHRAKNIKNKPEAVTNLKRKMMASSALYISHVEAVQNVVRLHNASSNAGLEEISASISSNAHSLEQFLAAEAIEANSVFDDLQGTLSSHQGEMAQFARELRQRFNVSIEHLKNITDFTSGVVCELTEESRKLKNHAAQIDEIQTISIADFRKAYEEQSNSDAEKLIADVTNLVSDHIRRQKELVDARLSGLKETVIGNKTFLDGHVSSMEGITTDAKRKWQEFSMQAENDSRDSADFSAAKHCRMELLLQQCVNTAETASKHWKKTHECINEMGSQHVSTMVSLVRNVLDSNEQHDIEIGSVRATTEEDVTKNSEDIFRHFDRVSEQECGSISGILAAVKAHTTTLDVLQEDHSVQLASIEQKAVDSLQQKFTVCYLASYSSSLQEVLITSGMDYEPTGTTPIRIEPDIPSKVTIESLRAMPMEALAEEFRENHSYESFEVKEPKPSLIPRSPLTQLN